MTEQRIERLIACGDCDALFSRPVVPQGCVTRCPRCGGLLEHCHACGPERSVAWAVTGVLFWIGANVDPFMVFSMAGSSHVSRLSEGVFELLRVGRWQLAVLVGACAIVVPLVRLLGLLWLQLPLLFGRRAPWLAGSWRVFRRLHGWGMLDVFLLGAFVALVKFGDYGEIDLGRGFIAFVGLTLASAAAHACFDPERLWSVGDRSR